MDAIIARRLRRHHLIGPASSPAEAVAGMCGAHCQIQSAAEVSVAMRVEGGTQEGVRRSLAEEKSLVKTFGPRGTVHLLPSADLAMWVGARSALPPERSPFTAEVRMSAAQTDQVVEAVDDALRSAPDGLTVEELTAEIVTRTGPWAGDLVMPAFQTFWARWRQAVATAADRGVLCFGSPRGRHVTYTSPSLWVPGFRPRPPAEAVHELVRHYLRSYGPATPAHMARWLGAPAGWMAARFADTTGLVELPEGFVVTGDESFGREHDRTLHLLPYFDAYGVGSHPRDRVFPGRAATRALNRGQAGNYPILLIDGIAAGVWHSRRSGRRLAVTVEPLNPLSRARTADLDDQVARLGHILDAKATLTVGEVTAGPHA
ncbi:winged helix DNA-binding domain-containing protein [Actinoplanes sp. NPDC000266]